MHTFRDSTGRTWAVEITVHAVKRCRAVAGVDLYGLVDDGFAGLSALLRDVVQFVDVLYVLCRDEAIAAGITDEDFGRSLAGDTLDDATRAFLAELTDFFPDPRVRAGLAKALTAMRGIGDRLLEHLEARIDALDPDVLANELIASSGTLPASSASTPVRSPSANST